MATNILMPALSPTMTEGNLARWLKKEGDRVKAGEVIAEIETDKATMEVEAVDEGILGRILVPDGTQGVKVNQPIAVLVEEGEAVPGGPAAAPAPAPAAAVPAPAAPAAAAPQPAPPPRGNGQDRAAQRLFVSPLARRMAQQAGLDLSRIAGSGPGGRIVKADVEAALARGAPQPVAAPAPAAPAPAAARPAAPPPPIAAPHTAVPHSTMRRVIARRLSESKATIPHFYVSMDVELDALLKLRADLNARAPKEGAPGAFRLSVNDLIIKAAAVTLRRFPNVNASWTEDAIIRYHDVDISVAVAIPDGLITPIIRKADQKGLAAISNEMRDLAERARAGKLKPEEFQGGGFSISNMGMYGVRDFAAVINPPQAAILAVGAGEKRAVVKDGALAIATVMTCTLSVDHRVVDGALAAEWLADFRRTVEDPLSLML
ncbi:acetyltransferase component of pyruvate dehydrogenase complex [Caldovatus sediminis]|uniref:Acetyltransferase component of pyruvate dehydrogenase complex n=1 Tax=Caldovatus sediminis TaxID=2041189 RepID=A0A8J3ECZ4_9PROT|nr:pyruvate dehydrogenase complex dihydrolipoamide acetyltransferase [Caldovatus sediminis]GGG38230.1 acetyltransferase component of pyruvate dehydrogenase complex [Caldovatus sediminis]